MNFAEVTAQSKEEQVYFTVNTHKMAVHSIHSTRESVKTTDSQLKVTEGKKFTLFESPPHWHWRSRSPQPAAETDRQTDSRIVPTVGSYSRMGFKIIA